MIFNSRKNRSLEDKGYYKQLYANKFEHTGEVDTLVEEDSLTKLPRNSRKLEELHNKENGFSGQKSSHKKPKAEVDKSY